MNCCKRVVIFLSLLAVLAAAAPEDTGTSATAASADPNHHKGKGRSPCRKHSAEYDVCVVGCGGSGAYTAVQLKKLGYRVLVLEQKNRCGGHCQTVKLPDGATIDAGVIVYENSSLILQTFKEWNVATTPADFSGNQGTTYNFYVNTAKYVTSPEMTLEEQIALGGAIQKWYTMYYTYFSALLTPNAAMPDFDALPADVTAALTGSFKDLLAWLATKDPDNYGVDANGDPWWQPMFVIFNYILTNGPGPVFEVSGLVALQNLTPSIMDVLTQGKGWFITGGCQTIYTKFRDFLGKDVKLDVKVTATRSRTGTVKVSYKQAGSRRSVHTSCRRMVVSSLQSLDNMRAIVKDLDSRERAAFGGVTHNLYGIAVVQSTATDANNPASIYLLNLTSADLPNSVAFQQDHPSYGRLFHVSLTPDDTLAATATRMHDDITTWAKASGAFTVPASREALFYSGPELHQYTPRARVPQNTPQMYKMLNGLQGYRNMYYTGALYSHNGQRAVWQYSQWLVDTHLSRFTRC